MPTNGNGQEVPEEIVRLADDGIATDIACPGPPLIYVMFPPEILDYLRDVERQVYL
jgi:hypothetical protein